MKSIEKNLKTLIMITVFLLSGIPMVSSSESYKWPEPYQWPDPIQWPDPLEHDNIEYRDYQSPTSSTSTTTYGDSETNDIDSLSTNNYGSEYTTNEPFSFIDYITDPQRVTKNVIISIMFIILLLAILKILIIPASIGGYYFLLIILIAMLSLFGYLLIDYNQLRDTIGILIS